MSVRLPRVANCVFLLLFLAGTTSLAGRAGAESPPPYVLQWGVYGTGLGQFHTPKGIAVDGSGNVFVTQVDIPCRVQKFTSTGSVLSAFGGCGTGNGSFDFSWDCAVDPQGNLWVVDARNDRVQKFSNNGTWILNIGGYGSGNGQFNLPYGVAVDGNGNVYVTDRDNSRVQKFTSSGAFVTKWGSLGSGTGQFNKPIGIGVDPAGNVYVADAGNNRIEKFNSNGGFLSQLSAPGSGDGQFNTPGDIAFDQSGNMYVTDSGNYRVQKLTSSFGFITKWGTVGSGDGQFYGPWGITVDSNNYVYVVDTANNRVEKFGPSGGGGGGGGNTPSGSNVLVTIDPTVSLMYGQVVVPGNTIVTVRSTGAALPKGILPVPSSPPKFYDITTTAVFTGNIQVTLNYNTTDYRGLEANLMLYHYDTSLPVPSWREVTTSLNTSQNKIQGTVQSLSVFVILEPGTPTAVGEDPANLEARLLPSAPNPFHASTQVGFTLPQEGPVRLQVFDLRGALVRTLMDDPALSAGEHTTQWNGADDRGVRQSPGMYFFQLATATGLKSQKVLLVN